MKYIITESQFKRAVTEQSEKKVLDYIQPYLDSQSVTVKNIGEYLVVDVESPSYFVEHGFKDTDPHKIKSLLRKNNFMSTGVGQYVKKKPSKEMVHESTTNSQLCVAILGYLDMYGDKMMESAKDKLRMLQAKKEVMTYCENIRDKKSPIRFSIPESTALYNTVQRLIKGKDLSQFVQRGMGIKHI